MTSVILHSIILPLLCVTYGILFLMQTFLQLALPYISQMMYCIGLFFVNHSVLLICLLLSTFAPCKQIYSVELKHSVFPFKPGVFFFLSLVAHLLHLNFMILKFVKSFSPKTTLPFPFYSLCFTLLPKTQCSNFIGEIPVKIFFCLAQTYSSA